MGIFYHIGNFLAKIFGKNADFLIGMFTKRTAFTVASLAVIVGMMTTLFMAVTLILNSISYIMPEFVNIASSWVVPDNINELVTAYIAFRIALALYKWKGYQFKFAAKGF